MSGPTSLLVAGQHQSVGASRDQQQQQQLIDNLYASTFSADSIEISGLEQQLLRSSSNKQLNRQQVNSPAQTPAATKLNLHLDLIDRKFNELARKILDELRQAQHSKEFFRALDEIIGEPPARSLAHQHRLTLRRRRTINDKLEPPRRLLTQEKLTQTEAARQPQSLPAEPTQQQQHQSRSLRSPAKSSIPTSTVALAVSSLSAAAGSQLHPIAKSATTANCQLARPAPVLKSSSGSAFDARLGQQQQRPAPAPTSRPTSDTDADSDSDQGDDEDLDSAHCSNPHERLRASFGRHSFRGAEGRPAPAPAESQAKRQQQPAPNPIVRSHTIAAGDRGGQRQQRALASLVTSSASANRPSEVSVASALRTINNNHIFEPASKVSARDAAASLSMYKPHMNYSTSLLGNHRLSDDDEIIIIPTTQSPSSMVSSASPDANYHNLVGPPAEASTTDELAERFSISRTKSFWERLSKGGAGKRVGANDNVSASVLTSGANPSLEPAKQPQQKSIRFGKTSDSHNFERMDSTGGSNNSNYSCSSSGDENTSGSQSHQTHPTVNRLIQQELNRQDRFRQTR